MFSYTARVTDDCGGQEHHWQVEFTGKFYVEGDMIFLDDGDDFFIDRVWMDNEELQRSQFESLEPLLFDAVVRVVKDTEADNDWQRELWTAYEDAGRYREAELADPGI